MTVLFLLLFGLLFNAVVAGATDEQKIKWQDMKNVTFSGGEMTSGRRAMHQITWGLEFFFYAHRFAYSSFVIEDENITCTNMGPSARNKFFPHVEWNCTTDNLWFGRTYDRLDVSCECYNHCDDDYVWIGSCSLDYTTKFINFWWGLLTVFIIVLGMIACLVVIVCSVWLCACTYHVSSRMSGGPGLVTDSDSETSA